MSMSPEGSVSCWIDQFKAGDHAAAQELWQRYFHRLVGLARKKLRNAPRRAADEEDVALSVLDSFYRGAEQGRFPQLRDRDDLWRLLVTITARKAFNLVRDEHRQKRGGGTVLGESAVRGTENSSMEAGLDQIMGQEPSPEFAALMVDECRRLLDLLGNADLRSIAQWKMEGHTTEEIATKLDCALGTVERKLRRIRAVWADEVPV